MGVLHESQDSRTTAKEAGRGERKRGTDFTASNWQNSAMIGWMEAGN